jgi:hypothetical protein
LVRTVKLRLRTSSEPEWIALVDGAEVLVRPPTTFVVFAAQAKADTLYRQLQEGVDTITIAGGTIDGLPPMETPEQIQAVKETLFVLTLADAAIVDWRNINDDDGAPLAFDPKLLVHFVSHKDAAKAFLANYLHPLNQVVMEGNA